MSILNAIIVDDEDTLRNYLRHMLSDIWPELEIIGEACNGNEALSLIRELEPDIVFLDIKMPGLSGLSVASHISKESHVVFITAYDEYAVKAFELEAVDYLLKPLEKKRLLKTVERLQQQFGSSIEVRHDWGQLVDKLTRAAVHNANTYIRWIKASEQGKVHIVPIEDVCYFKAGDKYTSVITKANEWLIKKPVKELELELDPNSFWRIHRGVIVNVTNIVSATRTIDGRYEIQLLGRPETITASRAYAHRFKQM